MNGLPWLWRCLLNPAGSSLSFPPKPSSSLGQRPKGYTAAPTCCFVWGLHQPACQLTANLAQLSGPWIPRPGLQPTGSSREGRRGPLGRLQAKASVCTQSSA